MFSLTQRYYMKKKISLFCLIVLITGVVIKWFHYRDAIAKFESTSPVFSKTELMKRRAYLIDQIEHGKYAVSEMPRVGTPFKYEWALVSSSMSAIALTNLAFRYPETRESSLRAVEKLVTHILSPEYRELGLIMWNMDPLKHMDLSPAQAWFTAHAGYVLSAYKYLGGDGSYDSLYTDIHEAAFRTIQESATPYLETYPGETYTADNVALYAALKIYDNLTGNRNDTVFDNYIQFTRERVLDSGTGIIKSYVTDYNSPAYNSRGSWTGWNSFFLPVIDSAFAAQQYDLSEKHFFDTKFGFRIFREYPHGVKARGDIDSGPVLFGGSTSGTAFIIGGAVWQNDYANLSELLKTAEFVGISIGKEKRHYLLAPLVGDAAILAMITATPWDLRYVVSADSEENI